MPDRSEFVGASSGFEDALLDLEMCVRMAREMLGDLQEEPAWLWVIGHAADRVMSEARRYMDTVGPHLLQGQAVGEGAACGRGEASPGGGAQRKEGVQPPIDLRADGEVVS